MIRYHGAFAPNAKLRAKIVPALQTTRPPTADETPRCTHAGRQSYAFLMKRVFAIDVEQCPRCGERQTKIKFVTTREEIERILQSIGYPNAPNTRASCSAA